MLLLISVTISQCTPILVIPTMAKVTVVSILRITLATIAAPTLAAVVIADEGEVTVIEGEDTMIDAPTMTNPTATLLPPTKRLPTATPTPNPTLTATTIVNRPHVLSMLVCKTSTLSRTSYVIVLMHTMTTRKPSRTIKTLLATKVSRHYTFPLSQSALSS
jgi:hypothetical protein